MYVVNVCNNDWANFAYDNTMALRSVGVESDCLKFHAHKNNYGTEGLIVKDAEMIASCQKADVVQVHHSDKVSFALIKDHCKHIVVYHAGTAYRRYPEFYNEMFNDHVDMSILALGEFWNLGAKNQHYLVGAIDTDILQPDLTQYDKLQMAHYPSNINKKGTKFINSLMGKMARRYSTAMNYTGSYVTLVPHDQNLKRISACNVYIELMQPILEGKPYGSWGITALEAAALGKVVITNHVSHKVYESVYGACGIFRANNKQELEKAVVRCVKERDRMEQWQKDSRNWVVNNHSYEQTGKRLLDVLNLL